MQLINNPFFAIHQVFALSMKSHANLTVLGDGADVLDFLAFASRRFPCFFLHDFPFFASAFEGGVKTRFGEVSLAFFQKWETDLLPLLVLTRRGRSTGKNQYW